MLDELERQATQLQGAGVVRPGLRVQRRQLKFGDFCFGTCVWGLTLGDLLGNFCLERLD